MRDTARPFLGVLMVPLLVLVPGCGASHPHGLFGKQEQIKTGMTRDEVQQLIEGWTDSTPIGTKPKWTCRITGMQGFGDDGSELPFEGTITWLGKAEHKESGKGIVVTFVDGKVTDKKWQELPAEPPPSG